MKILMVCLGNICRSPLAEGIMQKKIEKNRLDWQVDSAGTGAYHVGERPDRRSIEIAKENKINISQQRARQFRKSDFKEFDHILVMDASNYRNVNELAPNETGAKKVELIMNFVYPNENRSVPDPYWDDNGFEKVYNMLDLACEKFVGKYGVS